jgi:phosphoribosyl-ATP pyrophosphohydrolase
MAELSETGMHTLSALVRLIGERQDASPSDSYTAKLLSRGVERCAKKVGEEAVEFAIAAVSRDRDASISEAADLVFHLLVTLQVCGIPLDAVLAELARRRGTGGLAEKAARAEGKR